MNRETREIADTLPRSLGDQVLSYVVSVEAAADDIFREANVVREGSLLDQLLLVAALKKILGIAGASFWAIDNSLSIGARTSYDTVRIGGAMYGRGTEDYEQIRKLHEDLEMLALQNGVKDLLEMRDYVEVLQELASGRR
ncbi:MAG TPA: hypothetical protein VGM84_23540 [Steroidobacteraceae bacterium]|jgi:hypothetical protein